MFVGPEWELFVIHHGNDVADGEMAAEQLSAFAAETKRFVQFTRLMPGLVFLTAPDEKQWDREGGLSLKAGQIDFYKVMSKAFYQPVSSKTLL